MKIRNIEEAKIEHHIACEKIKGLFKRYGIPSRSRDVILLRRVILTYGFHCKNIKIKNKHIKPESMVVLNLLTKKAFLSGYLYANREKIQ
jgi:hypothetical protein